MAALSTKHRGPRRKAQHSRRAPDRKTRDRQQAAPAPVAARPAYAGRKYTNRADEVAQPRRKKMALSQPSDPAEQEADRVADAVMRKPATEAVSPARTATEDAREAGREADDVRRKAAPEQAPPGHAAPEAPVAAKRSADDAALRVREDPQAIKTRRQAGVEPVADARDEVSPDIRARIDAKLGAGRPLPADVRQDFEARLGADLSRVQLHTDSEADELCAALSARAFTVGTDVFFRSGEYQPETEAGRRLLAHELAHVLQNRTDASRTVMRSDDGAAANRSGGQDNPSAPDGTGQTYEVREGAFRGSNIRGRVLNINRIYLPRFKRRNRQLFPAPMTIANSRRPTTRQRDRWNTLVRGDTDPRAEQIITRARNRGGVSEDGSTIYLRSRGDRGFLLVGTETDIRERVRIPNWGRDRRGRGFHVDHVREMQLGGEDREDGSNYELLDGAANMSSGSRIAREIGYRMHMALKALQRDNPGVASIPAPQNWESLRYNGRWTVNFDNHEFSRDVGGDPDQYWSLREIKAGLHLNRLATMSRAEVAALGDRGQLRFFASRSGGQQLRTPAQFPHDNWLPRVDALEWVPNDSDEADAPAGTLRVRVFANPRAGDGVSAGDGGEQNWHVRRIPGIHGGYIERASVEGSMRSILRQRDMSPITLETVELTSRGLLAEGRLTPTIPLIRDADIGLRILGGEVELRKTFTRSEFDLPAPLEVSASELTVMLSSRRGIGVEGRAAFGIEGVGDGHVGAAARGDGFELEGAFNFDSELFDPAGVTVAYRDGELTLGGEIGIPEGKVRGIREATVNVSYSTNGGFSATGEAELDVPGVDRGNLSIRHSDEEGFRISGSFDLSPDTPGIRGGSISATVSRRADAPGYSVSATGEAEPDIPGISSRLGVRYEEGAITAEATADYARGMLSGEIRAGASNRSLDAEGNPTGEAGETIVVYGGGVLTVQIAPWLEGTAGVRFAPNGELTVIGEIGLPSALELFPRAEIDRSLLNIAVQVPIVPGIVAEIGGGLGARAGIGPGLLEQLRIGIEYNPEREAETHVTGEAQLRVPADAGLRLSVRAGIGLGITGASATGGLEIGGSLGIEGAAEAGVALDWMPTTGLDIRADLSLHAQPSFSFDVSGYVSVRALGFSVYDERWELASVEFGSDYRFGLRLPVHYREGEPFDIALDDVEFEVPPIEPGPLLDGLIDRIT